jgi:hypothetical protein
VSSSLLVSHADQSARAERLVRFQWPRHDSTPCSNGYSSTQRARRKPVEALVFRDETGEAVGRFRTAWVTAVLKSHDVRPEWKAYGWTALTADCQEQFRGINLHWHDLRHEYASRLVEKGVPLAQVRDLLGLRIVELKMDLSRQKIAT